MEIQKLYRGRLIDHVQLVVPNLPACKEFYRAVFEALELPIGGEADDHIWCDELFVSSVDSKEALGQPTGRAHLAFQAKDRPMVDRCYQRALAAGGKGNGKPGERAYHPGYYAGFVLDPAGNNLEFVFHGPAKQSAEAIEITF